jgi:hypothetical protein
VFELGLRGCDKRNGAESSMLGTREDFDMICLTSIFPGVASFHLSEASYLKRRLIRRNDFNSISDLDRPLHPLPPRGDPDVGLRGMQLSNRGGTREKVSASSVHKRAKNGASGPRQLTLATVIQSTSGRYGFTLRVS